MNILGINAYHGDASVALVKDGQLVGAMEEERLNRRKHCAGFPALAAKAVLAAAGVAPAELDHVAVSRDPKANLHKKILFAIQKRPSFTKLVKDRLANVAKVRGVDEALAAALGVEPRALKAKFHAVEHHKSHISSAFFVSPFEEAACLSIDGFGDFVSTMRGVGRDRKLEILDRIEFPHSAGLFYTAVTQFIGFHRYGEEWKMMGLAPYGKPTYVDKLRQLIHPVDDGRFELNLDYFRHHTEGVEMTWDDGAPQMGLVFSPKLADLLGPARDPEDPEFFGKWADIAHSAQVVYEEIFFHVLEDLQRRTGLDKLALAGGCALNSVANGKIFERTKFRELFAQPAAGDDGTAIGAAFYVEHAMLGRPRGYVMRDAYTGLGFGDAEIAGGHREGARQRLGRAHRRPPPGRRRPLPRGGRGGGGRPGGGVVPGTDGVRPARARQPLDRRRPAPRRHEGHPQQADQAPRDLPPVRPQRAGGEGLPDLRAGRALALHDAGLQGPRGRAGPHPGGDARRRHRPPADGQRGHQPALPRAHLGVRAADRRAP